MRRLAIVLFAAVLVAACSSSIPRHAAVYSPPPVTAAASHQPASSSPAAGSPDASVPAFDTSAWVTLAPAGEGFSVLMPGAAKEATGGADSPFGHFTQKGWVYQDSSNTAFLVIHGAFPAGTLANTPIKTVLDGIVSMQISSAPGTTLSSQSDITLNGHPGRLFTFGTSKASVEAEFFVVGDDFYGPGVTTMGAGKSDAGRTQAFFASFQLTV